MCRTWFVLFQWDTSSLVAVLRRFSMSLLTCEEAALALWDSSLQWTMKRVNGVSLVKL